ncbi:MAG: hypothetical protein ACFFBE_14865 [Promethearchaeota archaeon]
MIWIILLFLDMALFLLSFVYIILDMKNYENNRYEDLKANKLPKFSSRSFLFSLLALVVAVINSLAYY